MEINQIEQFHKLSWNEKFELIQLLWNDITSEPEKLEIPEEHKNILKARIARIESGKAEFSSWEEIRAKYELK